MKKTEKIIISAVLLVLTSGILFYHFRTVPDGDETLRRLLEDFRNRELNTTEEKNRLIPYQIVNGYLYYEKNGFYEYDYETKEKRKLWEGEADGFKIIEGKVYNARWNNSGDGGKTFGMWNAGNWKIYRVRNS